LFLLTEVSMKSATSVTGHDHVEGFQMDIEAANTLLTVATYRVTSFP
jgi:hypothetical protein